jgi:hypothetical protein
LAVKQSAPQAADLRVMGDESVWALELSSLAQQAQPALYLVALWPVSLQEPEPAPLEQRVQQQV